MSNNVIVWAKKNPGKSVLILGGLGVAIYLVLNSGGSSDGGTTVVSSGMTAADYQLAAQGQQLNAQLSGMQSQIGGQVSIANIQSATELGLAAYSVEASKDTNATNYLIAQLSSAVQLQNIAANQDVMNNQTAAQVAINADTQQTTRYAVGASMEQALAQSQVFSDYFTGQNNVALAKVQADRDVAIATSADQVKLGIKQAKEGAKSSIVSSIMSPLGKLFG